MNLMFHSPENQKIKTNSFVLKKKICSNSERPATNEKNALLLIVKFSQIFKFSHFGFYVQKNFSDKLPVRKQENFFFLNSKKQFLDFQVVRLSVKLETKKNFL